MVDQNNSARVTSKQNNQFKGSISAKLVISTKFLCEVSFWGLLEFQMSPEEFLYHIICSNIHLGSKQLCKSHFDAEKKLVKPSI